MEKHYHIRLKYAGDDFHTEYVLPTWKYTFHKEDELRRIRGVYDISTKECGLDCLDKEEAQAA